jgi:hypothetical protein
MRDICINFAGMHRKFTLLLLAVFFFSCGEEAPIPPKKMAEVLTDVMLLEGGNQVQYNFATLPDKVWQRDYAFVCKQHSIDTTEFKSAMNFLENHPEEFTKVLEDVITRLQKLEMKQNIPKP